MAPVTRALDCVGFLLDHGGQPILRHQLLAHGFVGIAHAGADKGPVVTGAGGEQIVQVDGLMSAMEVADAEMDDPGGEGASVVGGNGGGGDGVESLGRELGGHGVSP
jgi:hypothetical protein